MPSDDGDPPEPAATYATIDGFKVFWHPSQADRVHLVTADDRFVDEHGARPGLHVVFSSNPNSADYHPANFNRVARVLRAAGVPAPADVPVTSRRLADRRRPAGWGICPQCWGLVADLDRHATAVHPRTT